MKKYLLILFIIIVAFEKNAFTQTDSFDVFTYQPPEFFTKSELPSEVHFNLTNKDGSFCTIILYKSQSAKKDVMKDVISQWNEQVVKRLTKANKKPGRIYTQQMWDGWASTVAIGNFYQNKKKCVVMLYSFRKNQTSACTVLTFSDKIFKGPIESFSKNLHLIINNDETITIFFFLTDTGRYHFCATQTKTCCKAGQSPHSKRNGCNDERGAAANDGSYE